MKKISLLIFALFIGSYCKAQSSAKDDLVNTLWTLYGFNVNGQNYDIDTSWGFTLYINKSTNRMRTEVCNWLEGDITLIDQVNSYPGFTLNYLNKSLLLCQQPKYQFEPTYFNFFEENQGSKTFNYQIIWLLGTESKTLQIMSGGTTAYYSEKKLGNSEFSKNYLKIYPNPASYLINISSDNFNLDSSEIEIFDSLGKLCQRNTLKESTVNIQDLPKGIYMVRVKKDDSIYTNKFMKN